MAETTASSPMRTAYRIAAILTTLVIIVQFFLAGLGAFHDVRTGETDYFSAHEKLGYVIAALSIVLLVVAALARMGGRAVGMVAFLFVLAGPVQILLADAGTEHSEVWGALHAMVGALILGFCATLIRLGAAPKA